MPLFVSQKIPPPVCVTYFDNVVSLLLWGWCDQGAPLQRWVWVAGPSSSCASFLASPPLHSGRPHKWTWRCRLYRWASPSMYPSEAYWWYRWRLHSARQEQWSLSFSEDISSSLCIVSFSGLITWSHLQFEGVSVVGTGGEVSMN